MSVTLQPHQTPRAATPIPQPVVAAVEPVVTWPPLYRFSVEQYHRMGEQGILEPRTPVMLVEGLLVEKMTKYPPHSFSTNEIMLLFSRLLPDGWFPSGQNPVLIPERSSEPEPDVVVVRGRNRDFEGKYIEPRDVALVVEVAESSVRYDQTVMKVLFARARLPVYWIVNLVSRRVEVYTDPTGPDQAPDYRSRVDYGEEADLPLILDGREIARIPVRDLLPNVPPTTPN
jgi:Uma2 family endonuclease